MLLGVVQSLFLSLVILVRSKNNIAIRYFGYSLLFSAIVFFDTYLCYTGLIKNILFLNDSSEVFVLLVSPFIYFTIYSITKRTTIKIRTHWWHFILPIGYFLSQIPFYLAPVSVKYNAYLGAYYSQLQHAEVPDYFDYGYHIIKDIFDWLILFSFLFYTILSINLLKSEKNRTQPDDTKNRTSKYIFSRNSIIILAILLLFSFAIFYMYEDDGGDHYIAFFQTIITFSATYMILAESRFFEKSWIADKYETLGNSKTDLSFLEIDNFVEKERYFLLQKASLNDLASLLQVHPNQISKVINRKNKSNFNDFINQKRIVISKKRLVDKSYSHLTIEAIGESVGFKSKSAFYNAFKKHTDSSPSAFIKSISP